MENDRPCLVCGGRGRRLHSHAPGLEENFPSFRCFPCPECHNGTSSLTARQFDTGMLKEHNVKDRRREPRPEPERILDLTQGTLDILAACARADGAGGDPCAEWAAALVERLGTAAVRLLWLGEAQSSPELRPAFGPSPAKNRKRWRTSGGPAAPGSDGLRGQADDPGRLAELLSFVCRFLSLGADELDSRAPGTVGARIQRQLAEEFEKALAIPDGLVASLREAGKTADGTELEILANVCAAALWVVSEALITHPSADEPLDPIAMKAAHVQQRFEGAFVAFLADLGRIDPAEALRHFVEETVGRWLA